MKKWYKEGKAKVRIGNKGVSLEVKTCFASLLPLIGDRSTPSSSTTNRSLILLDCKKPTLVRLPIPRLNHLIIKLKPFTYAFN
jgi:hypothetical protein